MKDRYGCGERMVKEGDSFVSVNTDLIHTDTKNALSRKTQEHISATIGLMDITNQVWVAIGLDFKEKSKGKTSLKTLKRDGDILEALIGFVHGILFEMRHRCNSTLIFEKWFDFLIAPHYPWPEIEKVDASSKLTLLLSQMYGNLCQSGSLIRLDSLKFEGTVKTKVQQYKHTFVVTHPKSYGRKNWCCIPYNI